MEHQQIFATNIFLIDEFIPQSVKAEKKVIDDMKKFMKSIELPENKSTFRSPIDQ